MNIFNKRLVRFTDGTFGVRKGWFSYKYLDLANPEYWWTPMDRVFSDCKGSESVARQFWGCQRDVGEEVIE